MQTFYEENGILKAETLEFIELDPNAKDLYKGKTLKEGFLFKAANPTFAAQTSDIEGYIEKGAKSLADVHKSHSRKGVKFLSEKKYNELMAKSEANSHGPEE